jgi:hypothetical protein
MSLMIVLAADFSDADRLSWLQRHPVRPVAALGAVLLTDPSLVAPEYPATRSAWRLGRSRGAPDKAHRLYSTTRGNRLPGYNRPVIDVHLSSGVRDGSIASV